MVTYPILRRTLFPLLSARFDRRVQGLENIPPSGGAIIASNHVGYLDPMILFSLIVRKSRRKIYFLTKDEITSMLGQRLSDYLGMIPVRLKTDPGSALAPAIAHLQKGNLIGIFPEGSRNTTTELLKAKTGAVRLALASGAPIIPVGFFGPPGWTWKETIKNFFVRGQEVKIIFGKPMDFSDAKNEPVTKMLLDTLTTRLMQQISALCGKTYLH